MKKLVNKKIVLGLTGSIGSGKSTVARIFKKNGSFIVDADKIGHALLKKNTVEYKKILSKFGNNVLDKQSNIDRKKLGEIVFKDKNSLKALNLILHPKILKDIQNKIQKSNKKIVIIDAPLLLETGLEKIVDKVVVVDIDFKIQLLRLKKKLNLSKEEIVKRIQSQMPLKKKLAFADFIIDNSKTKENTQVQVEKLIRRLLWRS